MAQFRIRLSEPIYPLGQDLTIEADNAQDAIAQARQSAARFGVSVTGLQPLDDQGNPLPAGDGPLGRGSFSYNMFSELPNLNPGLSEQERLERERLEQERLRREREAAVAAATSSLENEESAPVDPNVAINEAENQLRGVQFPVIVYQQYDPVNQTYVPSRNAAAKNATRRLVNQKIENGTVFRSYRYDLEGNGPPIFKNFIVNASEATDIENPQLHEVGITKEAFDANKSFVDLTIEDIEQFTGKGASFYFPFLGSGSVPDWFETTMELSGKSIEEDGRFFTFGVGGGQTVEDVVVPGAPGAGQGGAVASGSENNLQGAVVSGEGDGDDADADADDDDNQEDANVVRQGADNIIGVFPAPDYPQADLGNFLRNLGYNLPTDADGREIPMDALTTLPGFPPELLNPANLFVRVESEVTLEDGTTAVQSSFIPNPAIEAALELYGREIQLRSNLAGDANDLIQAQISATGGVLPGPAGTLNQGDFNELATNLRVISSTGGRLSAEFKDGETEISLSPLAQADLTAEVLRQTGGRVGGFFDAEGTFVPGVTFDEYLKEQKETREQAFQNDLERIAAQNAPSILSTNINRQQSDANRRRGFLQDITNIYQNPAQLAAIVQAGGGPLLQLQAELAGTPNLPVPGGPTAPQLDPSNIIGYADGQPIFDPNTTPVSSPAVNTQPTAPISGSAPPMNQGGTINLGLPLVTGYDPGRTEADFAELNPLQQQQAFGSAAVFGKQPEDVIEDLASFTPGQQQSPLFGVGGTTITTRY